MSSRRVVARALRSLVDPKTGRPVTVKRLAEVAGCSEKTVGRWLALKAGSTEEPRASELRAIALQFRVSADTLLGVPPTDRPQTAPLRAAIGHELRVRIEEVAPHMSELLDGRSPALLGESALRLAVAHIRQSEDEAQDATRLLAASLALRKAYGEDSLHTQNVTRLERAAYRRLQRNLNAFLRLE
ncbi:MAG: hypothetical protein K2Y26_01020 [Gemmatimonadaceae bacterium]|nr:hypothetical protein [Gemmatimonadaceae bacterium]